MNSTSCDLLLEYLSASKAGSWEVLKRALHAVTVGESETRSPLTLLSSIISRNMSLLGHIEVAFGHDLRWRVCPSSLVVINTTVSTVAVLTGARGPKLLAGLKQSASKHDAKVRVKIQKYAPSRVAVETNNRDEIQAIANEIEIPLIENSSERILNMLPDISSLILSGEIKPCPSGYETSYFDPTLLSWVPVLRPQTDGLFRFDCYRPEYRFVDSGVTRRVERAVGVYYLLALLHHEAGSYHSDTEELSFPAKMRPPILYERAAVLATCAVPEFNAGNGALVYGHIDSQFASLLLTKLSL